MYIIHKYAIIYTLHDVELLLAMSRSVYIKQVIIIVGCLVYISNERNDDAGRISLGDPRVVADYC